jgi:hypothetical protein
MTFTASSSAVFKPGKRSSTAAGLLAIECEHLSQGLAATDYLDAPVSMPSAMASATAEAGSRVKPGSGPARFDFIIGVSVPPG